MNDTIKDIPLHDFITGINKALEDSDNNTLSDLFNRFKIDFENNRAILKVNYGGNQNEKNINKKIQF
jgi:hypothetical protein